MFALFIIAAWVEIKLSRAVGCFSAVISYSICFHFYSFSFCFLRDFLGWAVLLNFLVYITVPVVLQYTGILLGVGSFAIYINTIIGLAKKENYFWEQVSFVCLLCLCSIYSDIGKSIFYASQPLLGTFIVYKLDWVHKSLPECIKYCWLTLDTFSSSPKIFP